MPNVTTFVCLDSCVLIDALTKIKEGTEPASWQEFKKIIDAGDAKLLVPEIILLELESFVWNADDKFLRAATQIEIFVKNQIDKQFNASLLDRLNQPLSEWRKSKKNEWRTEAEKINGWLKLGTQIPFNHDVMLQTKRRIIKGRYPKPLANDGKVRDPSPGEVQRRDQDCSIVDSLVLWFANDFEWRQLLFCSLDGGFGVFNENIGSLDETFKEGLPHSQLFNDLQKLADFLKEKQIVTELSEAQREELKRVAMEKRVRFLRVFGQDKPTEEELERFVASLPKQKGKVFIDLDSDFAPKRAFHKSDADFWDDWLRTDDQNKSD